MIAPGRKPKGPAKDGSQGKDRRRRSGGVVLWAALLLTLSLPPPAVFAQTPTTPQGSPRAAVHDGFGRMVFDWDGPVSYSADVINGELVLRFDKPVAGEFRSLLRPLAKYLRSVSVSADRKMATFPLTHAVQVKAYGGSNNSVVVDLVDAPEDAGNGVAAPAPAAPAPATGPVSLLPQAPAASAAAEAPPAAAVAAPPPAQPAPTGRPRSAEALPVDVRSGEHGDYYRLVFTWPRAVEYKLEKQGNRATLVFARPGRFERSALPTALAPDISVISADSGGKATTVVLSMPADVRLRHFASGPKIVLDIVRAPGTAPQAAASAQPAAAPEVALPSLQPLGPQEKPKLPSESLAASGPSPMKPTSGATKAAPGKPADAAPPPAPPAVAGRPAFEPSPPPVDAGKVFSLSVPWDKPVAAAVFRRAGYLWLVFDRHQEVDTALLHRLGGEAVTSVEQLSNRDATVIRMVVQPDYFPSVRRDGLLWVVDLLPRPTDPKEAVTVTVPAVLQNGIGISISVSDAGNAISVADPEVGDTMTVVPVIELGAGVYPGRETPDVDLLPTIQGIALVPHVDGLDVRSSRAGVTVGLPGGAGLTLSSQGGRPVHPAKSSSHEGFFDVANWRRSDDFETERRKVEEGLPLIPAAERSNAHMEAARFFFSHGYAPEALGFLRMAADEEPTLVDTGPYRALRGACQVLMGRWDLAQADLDNPLVKDDPESRVWQAAAHAGTSESPADWDKALAVGLPIVGNYPKSLAWPLAALAATSAIAAGDDEAGQQALDILDRVVPSRMEDAQLDYLHGSYNEMSGQFDKALDDYDHAVSADNREYRARASLASAELLLKLGRITPQEAADRLDRLRFAWREEDFEFGLLRRLGELEIQAGNYPEALRTLRSLVGNYPDNKGTPAISKMMTDAFARLYLDGAADSLPPVSAIGLYDEFRDLTPSGAKGDEMIRKLADRLASVDLLDRAAALLKHQITYRLQGLDKARVGSQLALLDLLNQQPADALDALQTSDVAGLPPELQVQRTHLKARALADLDRVADAIQLLSGDNSSEAAQLRAEIYWRKQDWPNAATALEAMVPRPDRGATLDDTSARLVFSWATALCLGNDERGLAALRRNFGPAMAGTPYQDGFTLLTSALDRDVPDMPAVAAKIKEAEGFQTFMSNYRQRLQASGLSGIN